MKRGHIRLPYSQHSLTGLRHLERTGRRNRLVPARVTSLRSSTGVGLVELMVAVAIGLVLMLGAVSVFINSRTTYSTNEAVARMQENARYALDELTWDLQLAGYWGRNNSSHLVRGRKGEADQIATVAQNDCAAAWYIDVDRPIEGQQGAASSPYNGTCVPDEQPPGTSYYRRNTGVPDSVVIHR